MKTAIRSIRAVMMRELYGYVGSPVAYVFVTIFLVVVGFFTWQIGGFFKTNDASLEPFFVFQPWLYMLLVPAIGMRLWSEERRAGTLELLFTLPIAPWHAIIGKFLAGSAMLGLSLALTFPMVWTVNFLGDPDNGVILSGYVGSLLVAMTFLAVSSVTSAMTRNQVISFILSFVVCLLLNLAGFPPVTDFFQTGKAIPILGAFVVVYGAIWGVLLAAFFLLGRPLTQIRSGLALWLVALVIAGISGGVTIVLVQGSIGLASGLSMAATPSWLLSTVASVSVLPYYERLIIGIIEVRSLVYFFSIIGFCMFTTAVILQNRRAS